MKDDDVITRPGEAFPPAGLLKNHPRDILFADLARQFETLEQPCSLAWMQARSVSMEELQALSGKVALILRGFCALEPRDRIAFLTRGVFKPAFVHPTPEETTLGQRVPPVATEPPAK